MRSDIALVVDDRTREAVLRRGRDRQHVLRIVDRLQRWTGGQVSAVVGIAENELARLDEMDRVGAAKRFVGTADRRLRDAVDEAEWLQFGLRRCSSVAFLSGRSTNGTSITISCPCCRRHARILSQRSVDGPTNRRKEQDAVASHGRVHPTSISPAYCPRRLREYASGRRRHAVRKADGNVFRASASSRSFLRASWGKREDDGTLPVLSSIAVGDIPVDFAHPCAGAAAIVAERETGAHRVLQEAEAAKREALDFVHLDRCGRTRTCAEEQQPSPRFLLGQIVPRPCRIAALVRMFASSTRIGRIPAAVGTC